MEEKILAINPGSTSTKLALFEGERLVFKENVVHDEAALARYPRAADQMELRLETIRRDPGRSGRWTCGASPPL